jgi:hypothetical protein
MTDTQVVKKSFKHKGALIIGLFILFYCCIMLFFFLFVISLPYRNPAKHLTITQISSECGGQTLNTKVEQVEWTGRNELTCSVLFSYTCEIMEWQGDYLIKGNNLMLQYYPFGGSSSACLCNYKLKYTIGELEKRDYQITVEFVEK